MEAPTDYFITGRSTFDAMVAELQLLAYSALMGNQLAKVMLEKRWTTPDDVFRLWGWQIGIVNGTDA